MFIEKKNRKERREQRGPSPGVGADVLLNDNFWF